MKELSLKSTIYAADFSELTDQERELIEKAKASTYHSYALPCRCCHPVKRRYHRPWL